MVEGFDPQQQRPGSNSCLPTAVTAILRYYGREVTQNQVSNWCQEGPDGCVIDLAMDGLRAQDCDVIELTDDPEAEIRQYVNDAADPTPVLVTIKHGMAHSFSSPDVAMLKRQANAVYVRAATGASRRTRARGSARAVLLDRLSADVLDP
jgi:hypothetical protein